MRSFFSILFLLTISSVIAQESNGGKRLYAKSVLNQKAPELIVQEWLTKQPDTRGKFVLIDFSATWCHACRKAMPELNQFQKKFADKLVVIFITKETIEKVRAAKNFLVEVASAIDTSAETSKYLEVKGIPHNILIDPKGYVRWEGFPASKDFELTEEVLSALFEKYSPAIQKAAERDEVRKALSEPVLIGPVKAVTETDFTAIERQGEIQKGIMQSRKISLFNAKGNLAEESFFNSGDTLVSRSAYWYDAKENLTERNCYNPDGSLFTRSTFKYDSKGNRIEENTYDSTGSLDCKSSNKYDAKGNLIHETLFNSTGNLEYRSVYRYNSNGQLIEKLIYNTSGGLSSKYVARYDEKGNQVEENVYGPDGSLVNQYSQWYDENGKMVKENVYGPGGELSSIYTYKYDSRRNKSEESVNYPNDSLVIKYVYRYDEKGKQVETFRYDPGGELYLQSNFSNSDKGDEIVWDYYNQGALSTKFINRYEAKDKMGNWLKRVKITNKRPSGFTIREIRYHEQLANTESK